MRKSGSTDLKKNLLYLLIAIFLLTLQAYANDEISQEMLETKFQEEVLLGEDYLSDESVSDNVAAEVQTDEVSGNDEVNFYLYNNFETFQKSEKIGEETLFGKILHNDITRTDIPSYLLEDELTFNFEKGPISKLHPWLAYRGGIQPSIIEGNYSTEYENFTTQIGTYGIFKNPNYKFQFTFNPVHKRGTNYLDKLFSDAYIVNTRIPNHQIFIGNFRVNNGVEGGRSAYLLPFVKRSQIASTYGNYRSLGVKVVGDYEYIDYNLFAGSSGRYILDGFPGTEFNAWVNVKPLGAKKSKKYGKVTIGGGYNHGHNRIDYNVGSAYIAYHHKKIWTNFEAAIADGSNGLTGLTSNKSCGYAYTLGWKFNPHLQLIGRIDQFDPNRAKSHDLKREYTVGLNWFIKGQALRVVLNYIFCDNQNTQDSHKFILATQVLL